MRQLWRRGERTGTFKMWLSPGQTGPLDKGQAGTQAEPRKHFRHSGHCASGCPGWPAVLLPSGQQTCGRCLSEGVPHQRSPPSLGKGAGGACWETVGLPRPFQESWVGGQAPWGQEGASLLCFSIPAWIEVGGVIWLLLPQPPRFVPMWLLWAQGPMLFIAQLMEQLIRARQPSLWRKVTHFGALLERGEGHLAPFPVPSKQVLETKHPPSWTQL